MSVVQLQSHKALFNNLFAQVLKNLEKGNFHQQGYFLSLILMIFNSLIRKNFHFFSSDFIDLICGFDNADDYFFRLINYIVTILVAPTSNITKKSSTLSTSSTTYPAYPASTQTTAAYLPQETIQEKSTSPSFPNTLKDLKILSLIFLIDIITAITSIDQNMMVEYVFNKADILLTFVLEV
jgi:hypothetical protein